MRIQKVRLSTCLNFMSFIEVSDYEKNYDCNGEIISQIYFSDENDEMSLLSNLLHVWIGSGGEIWST